MKIKSVYDFYVKQRDNLKLELVTNFEFTYLMKKTLTKQITRPGLALTGFFEHFEAERIQLLGETEVLYLKSISDNTKKIKVIEEYFKYEIPLIIIAKGKSVPMFFVNLANNYKVPILQSSITTDNLYLTLRDYLDEELSRSRIVTASFVSVYNVGILIEGNEGYGKSETTLELIKNGHQFICDNNVLIKNKNGKLIGEAARDSLEERIYPLSIKGIGDIFIDQVFGVKSILKNKQINLRVIFSKQDEFTSLENRDKFNFNAQLEPLVGVKIPVININVSTNKSIATLIEMIAIQYLSNYVYKKQKGINNKEND